MIWTYRVRVCAALLVLLTGLGLSGCEPPTYPASPQAIAGTYVASKLELTGNSTTRDLLGEGFSIVIQLKADGTTNGGVTSGNMHFPYGDDQSGQAYDVPLTGTWVVTGGNGRYSVRFDQPTADTFLRDTEFMLKSNRLEGSYGQLRAVLQRTSS